MTLLVSTNRYAQEEILVGMAKVQLHHSSESRQSFMQALEGLRLRTDLDVVITGYFEARNSSQLEFGLAWFRKSGGTDQYQHPGSTPQNVFMLGGLVYHPHSDQWSIHT